MLARTRRRARDGTRIPSRRRLTPYLLLAPGLAWLGLFFVVPMVTLLGTSLQTRVPGAPVGTYEQTFRLANYVDAVAAYAPHFGRSLLYAGSATVLALVIGYPLAYVIALRAGRWRHALLVAVAAPLLVSFLLRTIAWRQLLADEGVVVAMLRATGLLAADGRLLETAGAVVAGLTYNFLPFMILPLYASLERLDPRLLQAASDLYAGPWQRFRRVVWPLSLPGVVAGTLLTFIPASGDYVNAALLGSPGTTMVGNAIDSRFLTVVDYPTAAALSFVLMAGVVVLVTAYVRRVGSEDLL